MRELRAEIEIAAPPERVWQVLRDFDAYPEWNPFMRSIVGDAEVGVAAARSDPAARRPWITYRPKVRAVAPPRSCAGSVA